MWALKGLARPARELACRPVTGKRHQGISPGGEAHADLHLAKRAPVDRGGRGRDVSGGGTQPEGGPAREGALEKSRGRTAPGPVRLPQSEWVPESSTAWRSIRCGWGGRCHLDSGLADRVVVR